MLDTIAQSIIEVEFVATTKTVNQVLWLWKVMLDLHIERKESTKVFVDNPAAIAIPHNLVFHEKTKHFSSKFYFLRVVKRIPR